MSWPIIIICLLAGLALVALEIVALPGAVSGICGGILVVVGVWQSYAQYGSTAGNITLLGSIAIGIAMLTILLKSGTWKRFSLNESSDGKANQVDRSAIRVGCHGICLSRLAPGGKAQFGEEIVEVHSDGTFLDEGTSVEVAEIDGYRIMVRPVADTQQEQN